MGGPLTGFGVDHKTPSVLPNSALNVTNLRLRDEEPANRTSSVGGGQPGEKFSIESILGKVDQHKVKHRVKRIDFFTYLYICPPGWGRPLDSNFCGRFLPTHLPLLHRLIINHDHNDEDHDDEDDSNGHNDH